MFDFTNLIVSNFIFGLHVFFLLRLVTGCVCSLKMATAEGQNITFETVRIFDIFFIEELLFDFPDVNDVWWFYKNIIECNLWCCNIDCFTCILPTVICFVLGLVALQAYGRLQFVLFYFWYFYKHMADNFMMSHCGLCTRSLPTAICDALIVVILSAFYWLQLMS